MPSRLPAGVRGTQRFCLNPGDWDASGWVVPHGGSGVPRSGYDHDQRDTRLKGTPLQMAYSPDAVTAVAVTTVAVDGLAR